MSFVTTDPEALTVAANNLAAIGSSMAAENSAASAPTTGVVPAAADPVSALQATQFAAYGQLYQQVSAQATAIYNLFVHTMRVSADSYGATEAANSVAAAPAAGGLGGGGLASTGLAGAGLASTGIGGVAASTAADPSYGLAGALSNGAVLSTMNATNIGSAASEFTGLGKGYITAPSGVTAHSGGGSGSTAAALVGEAAPAAPASTALPEGVLASSPPAAAAPVSPGVGQAPTTQASAPPSWAGQAAPVSGTAPAAPAGAGWTAAAPETTSATAVPAGVPAMASAGRGGSGFGKPRYGVKPKVTPHPEGV
ncbi:MAG TPA: PE domain-containing protein [Mycobacterium sp.]|nr:PE domain-containing protein [Mycobacterium sp.]